MSNSKTYYGIRFPFTAKDSEQFFLDLDSNPYNEIKSDLIHLIFTLKGDKLRDPEFGTNLLQYIFEPNDSVTQSDIKIELQEVIKKYFPGITLTTLNIEADTNKNVNVTIQYSIDEGTFTSFDSISLTI